MKLQQRVLGRSGIAVSEIGLGLWAAGGSDWGPTVDADVLEAIDCALELGVNFFDTADVYGDGHSERLLGRAMRGRRDRFVVASKIGWRGFDGALGRTAYASVQQLIEGVESNLERLETDYIDLIQSHISFRDPTMEVFLEGFERLQKTGKVRAFGVSTSDFEYLKAFNADGQGSSLQIDYSLLNRTPELEIFGYCRREQLGVIVRGSLAMGLLTGKFNAESKFASGDFRSKWQSEPEPQQTYAEDLVKVEALKALAGEGRTLAQAALQFTLQHEAVTSIIPGAKNAAQVRANVLAAQAPPLTASERALIDRVTPPRGGRKIWPA